MSTHHCLSIADAPIEGSCVCHDHARQSCVRSRSKQAPLTPGMKPLTGVLARKGSCITVGTISPPF